MAPPVEPSFEVPLSQHAPLTWEAGFTWDAGSTPAHLSVEADSDSSFDPSVWITLDITDENHDADGVRLTYEEAGLLHDRLGYLLGRETTGFEYAYGYPKDNNKGLRVIRAYQTLKQFIAAGYNLPGRSWRRATGPWHAVDSTTGEPRA